MLEAISGDPAGQQPVGFPTHHVEPVLDIIVGEISRARKRKMRPDSDIAAQGRQASKSDPASVRWRGRRSGGSSASPAGVRPSQRSLSRRQQLADIDFQGRGELLDVVQRYIPLAALDRPDVRAVQGRQIRQGLLREAACRTERAEVAREALPCLFSGVSTRRHGVEASMTDDFGSTDLK
jgi:hypothetical protein